MFTRIRSSVAALTCLAVTGLVAAGMAAAGSAEAATTVHPAAAQLPVPYGNQALLAGAKGELGDPTALAGANTGCRPTSAHPYPVVLVHATLANEASNWVTLSPLLANNGYCVYAFNYGMTALSAGHVGGLGDIAASAGQLQSFVAQVLARTGAGKVDLVGHSQGGMMPNYYIKRLGGASKVHTFIGIAPSNHGTDLSGLVKLIDNFPFDNDFGNAIGAPGLVQQEYDSAFIKNLFADGDTVAGPRYVVIETKNDEVVTPYQNAFLKGSAVTNITVQDQCPKDTVAHIGMFSDGPTMQDVLNQLSASPKKDFQPTCSNYGLGV